MNLINVLLYLTLIFTGIVTVVVIVSYVMYKNRISTRVDLPAIYQISKPIIKEEKKIVRRVFKRYVVVAPCYDIFKDSAYSFDDGLKKIAFK